MRKLIRGLTVDRKFRLPRCWSNNELAKFARLFNGNVVNVSAWNDEDKEGRSYRDYFENASSYTITNYVKEARGFQGRQGEIFLDLTGDLPEDLHRRFDVVLNHTVLEHIYDVHRAFSNLCLLSCDVVILVVPFVQQMHAEYGDFWRFTPLTVRRMFADNGYELLYSSFNSHRNASIYLFAIAARNPDLWRKQIANDFSFIDPISAGDGFENYVGCHAINNWRYRLINAVRSLLCR